MVAIDDILKKQNDIYAEGELSKIDDLRLIYYNNISFIYYFQYDDIRQFE